MLTWCPADALPVARWLVFVWFSVRQHANRLPRPPQLQCQTPPIQSNFADKRTLERSSVWFHSLYRH